MQFIGYYNNYHFNNWKSYRIKSLIKSCYIKVISNKNELKILILINKIIYLILLKIYYYINKDVCI
jgi:hypothetical protein